MAMGQQMGPYSPHGHAPPYGHVAIPIDQYGQPLPGSVGPNGLPISPNSHRGYPPNVAPGLLPFPIFLVDITCNFAI